MTSAMKIPYPITRGFIQSLRTTHNFVYAGNVSGTLSGGQCKEAHGEPNAFVIPTKWSACAYRDDAFFWDADLNTGSIEALIEIIFELIPRNKPIIIFPGIGTGYADLPERAPKVYAYIIEKIESELSSLIVNPEDIRKDRGNRPMSRIR